ncbi:hypothetical protein AArc1_1858 [Natrarchaeobaculum sulfurireducens]|uniref:Uncharacterized protein n=1 Tax=Natrarchaeobaculum sulfurireducens TaxID=2044521 RepID=A0A346PF86_9EURY|nr:hypothetical protein AArc1_1858 [Natrarchaeobaculum sulfurireducens]
MVRLDHLTILDERLYEIRHRSSLFENRNECSRLLQDGLADDLDARAKLRPAFVRESLSSSILVKVVAELNR